MHILAAILIAFASMQICKGQNSSYTVYYNFTYTTDTADMVESNDEMYILYEMDGKSYFQNHHQYLNDSLALEFESRVGPAQDNISMFQAQIMSKARKFKSTLSTRKDLNTGHLQIVFPEFGNSKILNITERIRWSITDEKRMINGIGCQGASATHGGRKYKAWFAEELPISDGPYSFSGLPGLIIEVCDERNWFKFVATRIVTEPHNRLCNPGFINENITIPLSRSEYVEGTRHLKENPKVLFLNATAQQRLNLKKSYEERFDLLIETN